MDWHKRYTQQATWTRDLRAYLFRRASLSRARRVLEVGCGTGAILLELAPNNFVRAGGVPTLHGLDYDEEALAACSTHAPLARLTRGDAAMLPYANGTFDITYCHFLLLWVRDPLQVLREMKRVTRNKGSVLALAEPDYNARADHPTELTEAGRLQNLSLKKQGADVTLGARLPQLLDQAGIRVRETGMIEPKPKQALDAEQHSGEWEMLEHDLRLVAESSLIERFRAIEARAYARHERSLYVPTYFAWGQV
jgi:ubiquinone/menaquinone biosynthesis C-methylase UbiE